MPRAAFYIDGFNLYHPIAEFGQEHLKWSNYWKLAELIKDPEDDLVEVILATAFYPDFSKRKRHEAHVAALENCGVEVRKGHYIHNDMSCNQCPNTWQRPEEKQGDINVALAIFDGAYRDVFDVAYLVSADSDQAATARLFKERFPNKRLVAVAPPNRQHSKNILSYASGNKRIEETHLDLSVLPGVVAPRAPGGRAVVRPREYAPPAGWVHPDDRP